MPAPTSARPILAALALLLPLAAPAPAAGLLDGPVIAGAQPRGQFRLDPGFDPDRPRVEAVQGRPNFLKVRSLDRAGADYALSRMVGQLWYRRDQGQSAWCTGFLVGPDLFLTNFHCIADMETLELEQVRRLAVAMEHLEENEIGPAESQAAVQGVLKMDHQLDYALLRLDRRLGDRYGWLRLEANPAAIASVQEVKIIQHPAGRSKEIVLEDTRMVRQSDLFLHYLADTEGGSSGSPVFALDGAAVIGLHHVGTSRYNEGVSMAAIAGELAAYLPGGGQPRAQAPVSQPAPQPVGGTPAPVVQAPATGAGAGAGAGGPWVPIGQRPARMLDASGASGNSAQAAAENAGAPAGGPSGTVLDLLLAPAPPVGPDEPPVSLGLPAAALPGGTPERAGGPAQATAPASGGVTAGQGGTGLMKLDLD